MAGDRSDRPPGTATIRSMMRPALAREPVTAGLMQARARCQRESERQHHPRRTPPPPPAPVAPAGKPAPRAASGPARTAVAGITCPPLPGRGQGNVVAAPRPVRAPPPAACESGPCERGVRRSHGRSPLALRGLRGNAAAGRVKRSHGRSPHDAGGQEDHQLVRALRPRAPPEQPPEPRDAAESPAPRPFSAGGPADRCRR